MNVDEMLQGARDTMTVSRVYGEPIERNGVTLIPAAEVMGGGGGGGATRRTTAAVDSGSAPDRWGRGSSAATRCTWEPAVDATKIALRGMLVAIVFLFVVRSVVKTARLTAAPSWHD